MVVIVIITNKYHATLGNGRSPRSQARCTEINAPNFEIHGTGKLA